MALRYTASIFVMILHFSGIWFQAHDWNIQSASLLSLFRSAALLFPGVVILFSMSGYFVTDSLIRQTERFSSYRAAFLVYLKKRFLRIYPALWLNTIFSLVILLTIGHFPIFSKDVIAWLAAQLAGIASTPGILKSFATGSVNGALWTVMVQIQFYILLAALFPVIKRKGRLFLYGLLCTFLVINIGLGILADRHLSGAAGKLIERSFLPYVIWFLIGAACRLYARKTAVRTISKEIPIFLLILYLLFGILLRVKGITLPGYYTDPFTGVSVSLLTGLMCILYSGRQQKPGARVPDISYELFLYHWIILNVLVSFGAMERPWPLTLVLFLIFSFAISAAAHFMLRLVLSWVQTIISNKSEQRV